MPDLKLKTWPKRIPLRCSLPLPKKKYLLDVSMVPGFSKLAHLRLMKKERLGLGKALNQLHFNDGIIPKAACIQIKLLLKGIRVGIHNVSYGTFYDLS